MEVIGRVHTLPFINGTLSQSTDLNTHWGETCIRKLYDDGQWNAGTFACCSFAETDPSFLRSRPPPSPTPVPPASVHAVRPQANGGGQLK